MKRSKKDISLELLFKILSQLKEYPKIKMVTPVGLGEPFLYPEWRKACTTIKREFPNVPLHLVTNGIRLTSEVSDDLCTILTKEDSILISMNAAGNEKYESLMGF
jgi:hypothetical protein